MLQCSTYHPYSITNWFLLLGNIYIADTYNNRVRKVTASIITLFAGTGSTSFNGDGIQASSAALYYPVGVAVDASGNPLTLFDQLFILLYYYNSLLGNVYIGDYSNYRVRKVTLSTGIITSIAGNGICTYSGDNGPATSASFNAPTGVALDSAGRYTQL